MREFVEPFRNARKREGATFEISQKREDFPAGVVDQILDSLSSAGTIEQRAIAIEHATRPAIPSSSVLIEMRVKFIERWLREMNDPPSEDELQARKQRLQETLEQLHSQFEKTFDLERDSGANEVGQEGS